MNGRAEQGGVFYFLFKSPSKGAVGARRAVFYAAILAAWQAVFLLEVWPDYIFPGPMQVLNALSEYVANGQIFKAALVSMKRIFCGYGISLAAGIVIGLMMGRIKIVDDTLGTLILGFQALPSVCWLPLAIIWFGLNEKAIIFIVVMGALFSITLGVEAGVKNTPPQLIKAAQTLGARGLSLYTRVILPAAMPSVLSGLKQGWSFAWRSLMAGELLYFSLSLGNLLQTGRDLNDTPLVMAVMVVIVVIGYSVDRLVFTPLVGHTREKWGLNSPS